jgi:hypothetical protein
VDENSVQVVGTRGERHHVPDVRGTSAIDEERSMGDDSYCCKMREKFILGIVAERNVPCPSDAADFMDFDQATPAGKPILRIKFCPFCGKPVAGPLRVV